MNRLTAGLQRTSRWLLCLAPTLVLANDVSSGQMPKDDAHMGVATCASSLCHGSSKPLEASPVLQNEYVTWSQFDPHSGAYRILLNAESKAIAERMGLGPAHEAPACLTCHAEVVPAAERGPRFQTTDGIGCESCHGGAERWLSTHYQTPQISRADNLLRGLVALERAEVRAETCTGCHVGANDKFANHRMMAAGHPRLVFELDTYTELWRTSGGRQHYRKDADYSERKSLPASVNVWTVGLIEAARQQVVLAEKHAGPVADFAIYACHSCHRDVRVDAFGGGQPSARAPGSLKALDTTPGDLRLQDSHARTLLVVADTLALPGREKLALSLGALQQAVNRNPAEIGALASQLQQQLTDLGAVLAAHPWNSTDKRRVLEAMVSAARGGAYPDPASAEQVAMGLVVLLAGLDLDRDRRAEIDALFTALQDDRSYDGKRFKSILERTALGR
jgi:hypothetical protein